MAEGDPVPKLFRSSAAHAGSEAVECLGMIFESDEAQDYPTL